MYSLTEYSSNIHSEGFKPLAMDVGRHLFSEITCPLNNT
jgi:hypothetical protein